MSGLPPDRCCRTSRAAYHGPTVAASSLPAEFVVDAGADGALGHVKSIAGEATRRRTVEVAEIDVEIFDLGGPVRGNGRGFLAMLESVMARDDASPLTIAILSFDRPSYLEQVLHSLRPQVNRNDTIFLFQDGAWNPHSQQAKGSTAGIDKCVALFRSIIPWGIVKTSGYNLGVAENYERAEQELFERMQCPHALFLEDDLVLSPNYLAVTQMLLSLAQGEPRISYVSAYGNFWASLDEQTRRKRELMHMHENWGFALTRKTWLAERPFRRDYLNLLQGADYTQRDSRAIVQFYEKRGSNNRVTSQDAARWIASVELGKVRLTTFPCHARNIGRVGVHFTKALYDRTRLAGARFFTGRPCAPDPPTDKQITDWLATERARFTTEPRPFYPGYPMEGGLLNSGLRRIARFLSQLLGKKT